MLIQIAVPARVVLDERLDARQIAGLALAAAGALLVQLRAPAAVSVSGLAAQGKPR
jgi:drug/metabolite transporter (DMT)-like permease